VLPPSSDGSKAPMMAGFGLIAVGLATAYWLIRKAGQGANRSLEADADGSG
jgi:hypothetical protein